MELLRKNLAGLSCLGFLVAGLGLLPQAPFSHIFYLCALSLGLVHLAAYLFFSRFKSRPGFLVSLSWFNAALLGVMAGVTGGLLSPFIFLFYLLIVAAALYGLEDRWLPFFAAGSYLTAVYWGLAGFPGTFPPAEVYGSRLAAAGVAGLNCACMLVAGGISRSFMRPVLEKLKAAGLRSEALVKKYAEMTPYCQLGAVTHRMAHDMRTPLASALGYLEFKAGKASDPDDAELLKLIRESLEQMAEMLGHITLYGRRSDMKKELVCLNALLSGVKALLSFHPSAAGVAITASFPDGELRVEMPRQELQLAFFNIVKNSLDAVCAQREKKIDIVLRRSGGHAVVEVSDTGPGIPEELLPKLLQQGGSCKADGAGVGLTITRDFIHGNGGTLEVSNGAGMGAQVKVRLPLPVTA